MSTRIWLPQHDDIRGAQRACEIVSLAAAFGLLAWHIFRLVGAEGVDWRWAPLTLLVGVLAADLTSGLIHWFADTWGSETMPIVGRRLLWPFRVHHINPRDFLRRDWIDTSGDVAALVAFFLTIGLLLSLDSTAGRRAVCFSSASRSADCRRTRRIN